MPTGKGATLLLTRPEPDSRRFAARLAGVPAVISPLLRIVPVPHDGRELAQAEGLVFTSVHAVPAAGAGRGRCAFCVGPRTGQIARDAGFDVIVGPGDAEGLIPLIQVSGLRLVHPHGRHVARPLPVPGVVVYDQIAAPLSPEAQALLSRPQPVIAPLFSPRSAAVLAREAADAAAPLWLAAISKATLQAWEGPAAARHIVAARPDADAMVAAICRLIGKEQS